MLLSGKTARVSWADLFLFSVGWSQCDCGDLLDVKNECLGVPSASNVRAF